MVFVQRRGGNISGEIEKEKEGVEYCVPAASRRLILSSKRSGCIETSLYFTVEKINFSGYGWMDDDRSERDNFPFFSNYKMKL